MRNNILINEFINHINLDAIFISKLDNVKYTCIEKQMCGFTVKDKDGGLKYISYVDFDGYRIKNCYGGVYDATSLKSFKEKK